MYIKPAGRWTVLLRPESKKETARWAVSFLRGGKGNHSGSHSGLFTGDVLHDQQGGNDAHQCHGQSQHGSHQSGEQEADQGGDTNRQGIGQLGLYVLQMVAAGAGGGLDGGVGDGGAVVTEQTAGNDRADSQSQGGYPLRWPWAERWAYPGPRRPRSCRWRRTPPRRSGTGWRGSAPRG